MFMLGTGFFFFVFDIKGNKGHASLVAGIDEEAGDVDSMYQLVLQRKGNLSAIEDEMDGK